MRNWLLVAGWLLAAPQAGAHGVGAVAPASGPAKIMTGLGQLHHPVSTRNRLAQRFFDQGLTLVYAFNHQEAVRSFERAAQLDPGLAMAHWGVALALGPNYNAEENAAGRPDAQAAIRRARALATAAPANEQAYIEALALRLADEPDIDPKKAARAYRDAMRRLMLQYPADLDAATLFAEGAMVLRPWRLWNPDGAPAEGTDEISAALDSVLRRDPRHIGANHFRVHVVDASPYPERGLASARRLEHLAPAAGHLVHMAAHIYDRVGDHAGSARANAAAIAADRAYIRARGEAGPYGGYYKHNLHFLAMAHTMQGRYRDAIAASRSFAREVAAEMPQMPEVVGYLPAPALISVRFGKWREVLRLPQIPAAFSDLAAVRHFARGVAFAEQGRLAEAEGERAHFADAVAAVGGTEMWGRNLAADVFGVAQSILDGHLALARNERDAAIAAFRAAAAAEDALAFDEPAPWYVPAREPLGRVLLDNGDPAAAEVVFTDELKRRPKSGRALFGLAAALKAQGKPSAAAQREFRRAWKSADSAPFLGTATRSPRSPQSTP
ncbi:MAG: hypothetical protein ABI831_06710 [Betaproteobacteria bacterium]